MNELNSVLIEGNLICDPQMTSDTSPVRVWFDIENRRTTKNAKTGVTHDDSATYHVEATSHLAEVCQEYLKQGRGVRVVGRLARNFDCAAYILAEHVEFKPERRTA